MLYVERLRERFPHHLDAAHPDVVAQQFYILARCNVARPLWLLQIHLSEEPDFLRKNEARLGPGRPDPKPR